MGNPKLIRTVTDQNIDDWTLENWTSARYSQDDLIGTVLHTSVSNREAEQAMYLESPGGRWPYYGAKFTFQQLVDAFPLGSMHSQKPSDMTLLADLFRRYGVVQKDWEEVAQRTEQPADPLNVYERGVVGENLFHLLMLTRTGTPEGRDMVKYLVCLFGAQLVNMPYQLRNKNADPPGEYEGETALHIAIVGKDLEMVRFLVEHGASLKARAWGTFFGKSGNCYSGEYPLSFAVSVGNEETVRYLISAGADVDHDSDMLGNYAVHLAVAKRRLDMYDLLIEECGANPLVQNNRGLSPLALAAMYQDTTTFCHILQKQSFKLWTYGQVSCYGVPMEQIDSVQDAEERSSERSSGRWSSYSSVISMVVLANNQMDIVVDRSTLLFDMLLEKWNRFGRYCWTLHLAFHLVDMLLFTVLVVFVRYGLPQVDYTATVRTESYDLDPSMCRENRWADLELPNTSLAVEFSHVGSLRCVPVEDTWLRGPTRFDNAWGITVEIANMVMVLGHTLILLYDWIHTAEFHAHVKQVAKRNHEGHRRRPMAHRIPHVERIFNPTPKRVPLNGWIARDSSHTLTGETIDPHPKLGHSVELTESIDESNLGEHLERKTKFTGSALGRRVLRVVYAVIYFPYVVFDNCRLYWSLSRAMNIPVVLLGSVLPRVAHFVMWLTDTEPESSWELAVAAIFEWVYLYYFCRGFQSLGYLVEMLFRMITNDVLFFSVLFGILLGGFGEAMYLLVRFEFINGDTQMNEGNYNTLINSGITMILTSLGDIHYQQIAWGEKDYTMGLFVTQVVFILWLVMSNLVMVNLLIALMGNTFTSVNENAEREWILSWSRIVLHMERRLPSWLRLRYRLGRPIRRIANGVEQPATYYHFYETIETNEQEVTAAPARLDVTSKSLKNSLMSFRSVSSLNWNDDYRI